MMLSFYRISWSRKAHSLVSNMSRLQLILSLFLLLSVDGFTVYRRAPHTTRALPIRQSPSALHSTIITGPSPTRAKRKRDVATSAPARPVRRYDVGEVVIYALNAVFEDLADVVHLVTSSLLWIRHPITSLLGVLPPSVRFFAQPFLILYLVPLLLLQNMVRPSRSEVSNMVLQ